MFLVPLQMEAATAAEDGDNVPPAENGSSKAAEPEEDASVEGASEDPAEVSEVLHPIETWRGLPMYTMHFGGLSADRRWPVSPMNF